MWEIIYNCALSLNLLDTSRNTTITTYLEEVLKKSSDNNKILNLIYLWLSHFQSSFIVLFKNAFFEGGIFNLGEFTVQNAWKYTYSNNF